MSAEPLILGFDTATPDTVVATWRAGGGVAEVRLGPGEDGRPVHNTALLKTIEDLVADAGGWD